MAKEKRSNKWAFLLYQESAPENYLDILEEMHVPFVLSPWHDKDVNRQTGGIIPVVNIVVQFVIVQREIIMTFLVLTIGQQYSLMPFLPIKC
ncbi:Rep family protein, partial [Streptococcus halichoeri]|uniref:Rep family protein n=1 Tax=Streptococcus halichoeri TaxID=254785 RepID=UPI001F36EB50